MDKGILRRVATIAVGAALLVGLCSGPLGAAPLRATAAHARPVGPRAQRYVYFRTPRYIYENVTHVPLTVYNAVGVTSSTISVNPPLVLHNQPAFTYAHDGTRVPGAFFYGAEWCPYCAVTRWGLIAALSRFGRFTKLYNMYSSATDYAPNTPTFTFFMTAYKSPHLFFRGYEVEGPTRGPLMMVPPSATALIDKYNPQLSFPFVDFGNLAFVTSSAFDPLDLAGRTRVGVAAGLRNPHLPITRAIISSANYYSAAICSLDKQQPVSVCTSLGVLKADAALHLSH